MIWQIHFVRKQEYCLQTCIDRLLHSFRWSNLDKAWDVFTKPIEILIRNNLPKLELSKVHFIKQKRFDFQIKQSFRCKKNGKKLYTTGKLTNLIQPLMYFRQYRCNGHNSIRLDKVLRSYLSSRWYHYISYHIQRIALRVRIECPCSTLNLMLKHLYMTP
jgi:hypothetical protein